MAEKGSGEVPAGLTREDWEALYEASGHSPDAKCGPGHWSGVYEAREKLCAALRGPVENGNEGGDPPTNVRSS